MIISLLLLAVGLTLLIFGADALVRGVSAIAAALGVPPLVIGMTVVAFGTSTPEVVVNSISAWNGQTDLAFGNIVGACGVNIGFVLALTAIIKPLQVESGVITRETPLLLLTVAAVCIMSIDTLTGSGTINQISRSDGLMLMLLFAMFLYITVLTMLNQRERDKLAEEIDQTDGPAHPQKVRWLRDGAFVIGGLVGVGVGGRVAVAAAVELATLAGVGQALIGLTIVSFGTTLPELTTSILAARRGLADIAIGNVIGSCIFNLLFIGGIASTIYPIAVPPEGRFDLIMLATLTLITFPMLYTGRRITRPEGFVLLTLYIGYVVFRAGFARGGA